MRCAYTKDARPRNLDSLRNRIVDRALEPFAERARARHWRTRYPCISGQLRAMRRRTLERVSYEGRFDHGARVRTARGPSLRRELPPQIDRIARKMKPSNSSLRVLCVALLGNDFALF